jgi:hypothetical protein
MKKAYAKARDAYTPASRGAKFDEGFPTSGRSASQAWLKKITESSLTGLLTPAIHEVLKRSKGLILAIEALSFQG